MIEIVDADRCTSCNICVHACPTNVFDAVEGGIPVIARQEDCQTCFMCELYCPVDALYVAANPEAPTQVDRQFVESHALMGSYRRAIGWSKGSQLLRSVDKSYQLLGK